MSVFKTAVLALSPSIYLTLDNVTGLTDQSGNGRNGTGVGSLTVGGNVSSPITGESTSTDFSGSGQYIDTTYQPWTNGTSRSVGAWVWRDGTGRDGLFGSHNSPFTSLEVGGPDSDATGVVFTPNWGTNKSIWASTWPGSGQWVFLGFTFNETSNQSVAYINGTSLGAKENVGQYTNGKNLRIGTWNAGSSVELDGKLVHFFMVEGIVSAETWASLYAAASQSESAGVPQALSRRNPIVNP